MLSASDPRPRFLVAAGTAHFPNIPGADLDQVPQEIERIARAFRSLGYHRLPGDPASNRDEVRKLFVNGRKACDAEGGFIVAYYSAHGARETSEDRFYLLTQESDPSDLGETALAVEDLWRALCVGAKASQVLIILDACYAGAGAAQLAHVAARLAQRSSNCPELFVIAAAGPKQEADQGALSLALEAALTNAHGRLGSSTQEFLQIADIMREVKRYLSENYPAQQASHSSIDIVEYCYLFPNPRFRPGMPSGLDLEIQRAYAGHWVPKARGAPDGTSGWYFTGRSQALKELVEWLEQPSADGRARVVTGGPGAGKSALLARIVTLSDPASRGEVLAAAEGELGQGSVPPASVVSVAVHARHMLLNDVVRHISQSLGCVANDAAELIEAITHRPGKTVVVVDALDEADEKLQIVSSLLRPLAELGRIFLLVGTRPDTVQPGRRFRGLGEAAVEINLDAPHYIGPDDVRSYVERRLLATEEPGRTTAYRSNPALARQVALAVSTRAGNVFLVAHAAVVSLLTNPFPVEVDVPGWAERLPAGLESAFQFFLDEIERLKPGGLRAAMVQAVLLPLAFAEGEGLPWLHMWQPLAAGISKLAVSDEDIVLVREHAAAFIVEAVENQGSVYRLYHEKLAEHLRGLFDPAKVQQRIVDVLRSGVPAVGAGQHRAWAQAHPYTRTHLATHAVKGGVMDGLVGDGIFIAAADPVRMLLALSASREPLAHKAYPCYELAYQNLAHRSLEQRVSYMEMAARQIGNDELADLWTGRPCPRDWAVPWIRSLHVSSHRVIPRHRPEGPSALATLDQRAVVLVGEAGAVQVRDLDSGLPGAEPLAINMRAQAIAAHAFDHETIVVFGGGDGSFQVWNLTLGALICRQAEGHDGMVDSISIGVFGERRIFVSGGSDGTVRVWDLMSGAALGMPLRGHLDYVTATALAMLDGRPVIVSGAADGTIRVWCPASGAQVGATINAHAHGVHALAAGEIEGRPVIVSGGAPPVLQIRDLGSGALIGQAPHELGDWVGSLAIGKLGGREIIVSGHDERLVRLWDLASGAPIRTPLRGHDGAVDLVGIVESARGTVIVSGGDDNTVRVWDAILAEPDAVSWDTATSESHSLATAVLNGRSLVVSGGCDGKVRVWDAGSGAPVLDIDSHDCALALVAVGRIDHRPVVMSGGYNAVVKLWDLASGALIDSVPPPAPPPGHGGRSSLVGLLVLGDRPIIVWQTNDYTLLVYDAASGQPVCGPLDGHTGWVRSSAVATIDDLPALVSSGDDGMVRTWDLSTGRLLVRPLRSHERGVRAIALAMVMGRWIIVCGGNDGTLRQWDLLSRTPIGQPLQGQGEQVNGLALQMHEGRVVIFAGGEDRIVRLWDADGRQCAAVQVASRVMALVASGGGSVFAATSSGVMALQFALH
ncbi:hypothetical protein D0T25_12155 [Duganella sp. BJB488]|uniref:caspase family protein n=1 Tax=unclassified Duganella TaxID=2636909 RepID=UPI000E34BF68|nr:MULTISPECIES: caspase family protein [unclassified Duganella]RFP17514.1 hypothetical protein D0T26_14905 [Duganella sp. BJB489]RFP22023.1 hypothetical protein D0T25_12155 [Duganella sp. BJB488]RFP37358.1 hypothetical protein D0T24_05005 [Duganella sp. BJB480]